ncbi:MAG: phosphohistidine phosphatase SixA [Acidobacteriota bacterium]|nr:phosphohistidine phosphatase SixA [Acidobacteriota bacterium]
MANRTNGQRGKPRSYEIYLMRHGIAADRDPAGTSDDSKRPLTVEGKLKLRDIARGLDRMGVTWDWVITSPLKRAVETADALVSELGEGKDAPRDITEHLDPGAGSAQKVYSLLGQHPDRTSVLLVGHMPSLAGLASEMLGAGPEAGFEFKKGGCCLIRFEEFPTSPGSLCWWLTPRILRKIGS